MSAQVDHITQQRLLLLANGYLPIPVTSPNQDDPQAGKRPALREWTSIERILPSEVRAWERIFPRASNTGIICGHIVGVDIDVDDERLAERLLAETVGYAGQEPPVRIGRAPRALAVFQTTSPFKKMTSKEFVLLNGQVAKIEILGQGQQFVAEGEHPRTHMPYFWKGRSLAEVRADELPNIDADNAQHLIERLETIMIDAGAEPRDETLRKEAEGKRVANQGSGPANPAMATEALSFIPNENCDYDFWLRIGFSIHNGLGEPGFALWDNWSKQSTKYNEAFTLKTWNYFKKDGGVTIGTLFHLAAKNGWRKQHEFQERPSILVINGALHEAVDAAERALIESHVEIFQRGGLLVRPVRTLIPCSSTEATETVTLVQVTESWLLETFSRIAVFQKCKGETGELTTINCPTVIVKSYLARVGEWRVPLLTAVVHYPTLRADGMLIEKPGYDKASGLYASFEPEKFPQIPTAPDREAALQAIATLEGIIKTFPFVSSADRSVAIASFLTGITRHLFPSAPIFGFSAPVAGSGKSLLVDLCSLIITNNRAAVLSPGRNEEELEKRLSAAFIQGLTVVSLDNCHDALGGAFLCQSLTQSRVRARILGQSTIVEMPTNCLMMATGNNLTFADDMTRRALLCTLDPQLERPEERQFTGDILTEVQQQRGKLIAAGLTVLQAFFLAGQPSKIKLLGSFAEWSRLVRGALVWLDRADPCDTMEKVRENDPVLLRTVSLLHQIDFVFGPSAFTTAELIETASLRHATSSEGYTYTNKDLHLVLSEFSGGKDSLNAVSIGRVLSKLEGRVCGGMMLKKFPGAGGKRRWQLAGGRHRGVNNII